VLPPPARAWPRPGKLPLPERGGGGLGAMNPGAVAQDIADAVAPKDLVELGVLRGAYGLQGWSHVQPHSGDAQVLRLARQW